MFAVSLCFARGAELTLDFPCVSDWPDWGAVRNGEARPPSPLWCVFSRGMHSATHEWLLDHGVFHFADRLEYFDVLGRLDLTVLLFTICLTCLLLYVQLSVSYFI